MRNGDKPIWKDIDGYEGLYEVSSHGEVRSLTKVIVYLKPFKRREKRVGRLMSTFVNKQNGYVYINLTKDKIQKGFRVHRLVAQAFIPNPDNLPEVNHEDYNKENNNKTNLKWCDRFYQNQHSAKKPNRKWQNHRLGKTGIENPKSKKVDVFLSDGQFLRSYDSQSLAAKDLNCQQAKISACCLGKRKSHSGYKFKYS